MQIIIEKAKIGNEQLDAVLIPVRTTTDDGMGSEYYMLICLRDDFLLQCTT